MSGTDQCALARYAAMRPRGKTRKGGTPTDARLGFLKVVSTGQQVESPTP